MTTLDDDTIKALRTLLYEMETGARDIARRIGGENPAPTWADKLALENKNLKQRLEAGRICLSHEIPAQCFPTSANPEADCILCACARSLKE